MYIFFQMHDKNIVWIALQSSLGFLVFVHFLCYTEFINVKEYLQCLIHRSYPNSNSNQGKPRGGFSEQPRLILQEKGYEALSIRTSAKRPAYPTEVFIIISRQRMIFFPIISRNSQVLILICWICLAVPKKRSPLSSMSI